MIFQNLSTVYVFKNISNQRMLSKQKAYCLSVTQLKTIMKNIIKLLLSGLVIFQLMSITACKKDTENPDTGTDPEVITTVQLEFTPTTGGTASTFVFSDVDGPGGDAPLIDEIRLAANTSYELKVEFIDNSDASNPEFITDEVQTEAEEHLVCYSASGAAPTPSIKDQDSNGDPLGLVADVQTGAVGNGILTISLKHEPNKGGSSPCSTGETDVEASFTVVLN